MNKYSNRVIWIVIAELLIYLKAYLFVRKQTPSFSNIIPWYNSLGKYQIQSEKKSSPE